MDLRKDPYYHLIVQDNSYPVAKVFCFYFSDCYYDELFQLFGKNKKLASLFIGEIMTHTYYKFLMKNLPDLYYEKLSRSRFNIQLRLSTFKIISDWRKRRLRGINDASD